MPTQLHTDARPESNYAQQEKPEQALQHLKTVHMSNSTCNMTNSPHKLAIITQTCGLCSRMVICHTVHSGDNTVLSGNQCTT